MGRVTTGKISPYSREVLSLERIAQWRNKVLGINPHPRLRTHRQFADPLSYRDQTLNLLAGIRSENIHYLEIGVRRGRTLERIRARQKTGVEPAPLFDQRRLPRGVRIVQASSDAYFSEAYTRRSTDLVFIDGLHTFEQSWRDFCNAAREMNRWGVIVLDDVWPQSQASSLADPVAAEREKQKELEPKQGWQGDVWKTVLAIQTIYPWLSPSIVGEPGRAVAAVWGDWGRFCSPEATKCGDHISCIDGVEFSTAVEETLAQLRIPLAQLERDYGLFCGTGG